jgi:hypothetical protein
MLTASVSSAATGICHGAECMLAGIVRPIRVDHQRSDQGAEIDQVVPVTPIARQARSFQAKHRANRSRADQGNQLLKAGTFDQSASGATEIVIDHGDGGESDRSRRLDQCVLPPLLSVCSATCPGVDWRI